MDADFPCHLRFDILLQEADFLSLPRLLKVVLNLLLDLSKMSKGCTQPIRFVQLLLNELVLL